MPETATYVACQLCSVPLKRGDDFLHGFCYDCKGRPEAARILARANGKPPAAKRTARPFTAAEQSLIRALHGHVATTELLRILNERMHADLGPEAPDYTLEQLHSEIARYASTGEPEDWTSGVAPKKRTTGPAALGLAREG